MGMSSNDLNWRSNKFKRRRCFKNDRNPRYKEQVVKKLSQSEIDKTFPFRKEVVIDCCSITSEERNFFINWAKSRHITDQYIVLALTYWSRVKGGLGVFFLLRKKELYMLSCIHLSLKWLGYDEEYKCNFIADFRQISKISQDDHKEIELHVLKELNWVL